MRTRRDQVQAYRFVTRRIVGALLSGEPETTERPMRRLGLATFASAMVAALVLAGVGVWGLVTGQSSELAENTLVVEEESQARYVYVQDPVDGIAKLHPVENYASARLILGDGHEQRELPRSSLQDIPQGQRVGIPGAPDGLPRPEDLVSVPWRVCNVPPDSESQDPLTTLVVGEDLAGGSDLGEQGLYVASGGARYLLWSDRLLRITHDVAPVALGLSAVDPVPVATQLVNATTTGPDLEVNRPAGFNEPTDVTISGRQSYVGHIYLTADQYYVMTRDGLVPLGELTVALRLAIGAAQVRDITGAEVTREQHSTEPLEPAGFPLEVPEIHPAMAGSPTICASFRGAVDEPPATTVEVFDTAPARLTEAVELLQTERDEVPTAHRMLIPPGRGALVQEATPAGVALPEGRIHLITSEGRRYPLGAEDARTALGYGDVDPVPVPADLIKLVPEGPVLDVGQARRPAGSDGDTGTDDAA